MDMSINGLFFYWSMVGRPSQPFNVIIDSRRIKN